jgi:hypothetical protein
VLLDVQRDGGRVVVAGLAPASAAGRQVSVETLLGFTRLGTPAQATIGPRGTFSAAFELSARSQRAQVRYAATLVGLRSRTLRLERKIEFVSRTSTSAGTRIAGRVSGAGRRTVAITCESACNGSAVTGTVRTTRTGRFTALLPRPPRGGAAFYRLRAVVAGARTFSLIVGVAG